MPLTHVSMWTDNGFMPVTAEQVAKLPNCRYSVPARSGLFLCRLCNQYVAFSSAHYFMHSRGDQDKDCPERLVGFYESITTKVKQRALPIRLTVVDSKNLSVEIGIALPSGVLTDQGVISIESVDSRKVFSYNISRLTAGDIEYVSLQQDLSSAYKLKPDKKAKERLKGLLPEEVKGVSSEGTLFRVLGNSRTAKKVLHGMNVHVNTKYYLLTQHQIFLSDTRQTSLSCFQICRCIIGYYSWYVYEVNALRYDDITRRFFLKYRFILSESIEKLVAVWPIYHNSPYVTYHDSDKMWFYLHGEDISAHSFPAAYIQSTQCGIDADQVLQVYCNGRQQTLLAGKSKILRYTYLWREQLTTEPTSPTISVTDLNGNPIPTGKATQIPPKRTLRIQAPFDGKVLVRKNGLLIEKRILKAELTTELDQITYDMEIQVLQGLDPVWSIYFRTEHTRSANDELLYQQLARCNGQSIPFPHRYGVMANYINDMPKVSQWIRKRIRSGNIPEDALLIVQKIIREKRDSHD